MDIIGKRILLSAKNLNPGSSNLTTSLTTALQLVRNLSTSVGSVSTIMEPGSTTVQSGRRSLSPLSATVSPLSATVSPLSATVKPMSATVQLGRRSLSPLSATVSPLSATVKPLSATVKPLCATVKPLSTSVLSGRIVSSGTILSLHPRMTFSASFQLVRNFSGSPTPTFAQVISSFNMKKLIREYGSILCKGRVNLELEVTPASFEDQLRKIIFPYLLSFEEEGYKVVQFVHGVKFSKKGKTYISTGGVTWCLKTMLLLKGFARVTESVRKDDDAKDHAVQKGLKTLGKHCRKDKGVLFGEENDANVTGRPYAKNITVLPVKVEASFLAEAYAKYSPSVSKPRKRFNYVRKG